ncbi:hypothetical protein ONZ43_g2887 [Nemania bipapillata]|uniref:Uncharacterized protein n=1 Tax=Nemania bipapillata TaxID=110536 RepID=A0ACC2IYU8_9PEZI|nr:hypothetical protein ONZ43_g2887 [Nemania bipapillata]
MAEAGIKVLVNPKDKANFNILLVPNPEERLEASANQTSQDSNIMYLKELLKADLPTARILAYEYGPTGFGEFKTHTDSISEQLAKLSENSNFRQFPFHMALEESFLQM